MLNQEVEKISEESIKASGGDIQRIVKQLFKKHGPSKDLISGERFDYDLLTYTLPESAETVNLKTKVYENIELFKEKIKLFSNLTYKVSEQDRKYGGLKSQKCIFLTITVK